MNLWEENVQRLETRRKEYPVIERRWEFLQGTRVLVLGSLVYATSWLLSAYRPLIIAVSKGGISAGGAEPFDRLVLFFIPLFGAVSVLVSYAVEQVIQDMYRNVTNRGRIIEQKLGIAADDSRSEPSRSLMVEFIVSWLVMLLNILVRVMWALLWLLVVTVLLGYHR